MKKHKQKVAHSDQMIMVRVSIDLKERIDELAADKQWSLAQLGRNALIAYLENHAK